MKKFSRREYLQIVTGSTAGVLLFNPYRPLFKALVDGLISSAQAATVSQTSKNYLVFLQYGAPNRWMFDTFLNPTNESAAYVRNGSVQNFVNSANGLYSGVNGETSYRNGAGFQYLKDGVQKTIHMPLIWDAPLPVYRNGVAEFDQNSPVYMRDYLRNAMIIRGVSMGVDIGHIRGPELVVRPTTSSSSLTGLVAEANGGPMPAIGIVGGGKPYVGYRSQKGSPIAYAQAGGDGPLYNLLEPFVVNGAGNVVAASSVANELLMEQAMNEALAEIRAYALSSRPGSEALYDSISGTKELFSDAAVEFTDLKSEFNAVAAKYKAVTSLSRTEIPGLLTTPQDINRNHSDLFSTGFAVAEYLIKKGYTTSFSFHCGTNASAGDGLSENGDVVRLQAGNDEHSIGNRQVSFMARHFVYRSFMACLHAFRESIGESEWSNTVVQIGAEFGRRPRDVDTDGGSDHAPNANTYSLFSGAIRDFIPIGNIVRNGQGGNAGTWGASAPTQVEGIGGPITITKEVACNTVADLIGVAHPVRNAPSLIRIGGDGNWVSKAEDPKNV